MDFLRRLAVEYQEIQEDGISCNRWTARVLDG